MNSCPQPLRRLGAGLALLLLPALASAQEKTASPAPAVDVPPMVSEGVSKLMPGVTPSWVKPAPMADLWEVAFGPHIFYFSADGRYVLRGDILTTDGRENLTRPARNKARLDSVESLGEATMIVFSPDTPQHTVTVFTDVDCGYCAKLHSEMQSYLDAGIRVRYVAFPRAGIGSESYERIVSVWCAEDQRQAMTDAKAGRPVPRNLCPSPVADHYQMGQLIGVRGTPSIVLETGDVVPGYVPADRLLEALRQSAAEQS
jgi:thiol:disulfide interchange protein DsbC